MLVYKTYHAIKDSRKMEGGGSKIGPSRIRTYDHPLRRRVLYPLSYQSKTSNKTIQQSLPYFQVQMDKTSNKDGKKCLVKALIFFSTPLISRTGSFALLMARNISLEK